MDTQMVRPHHCYFFSSLKHPKNQQQKPVFEAQRSRDASRRCREPGGNHPGAPPAPTSLLLKAPGAQTGPSGARQEVCRKRAAALIEEDVFNVEERQCLPRIRELRVAFFPLPVS